MKVANRASTAKIRLVIVAVVLAVVLGGALYWVLRPAPTWPSAFCQPVVRVVGTDAVTIVKLRPSTSSEVGVLAEFMRLQRDVEASLAHAPTPQLHSELTSCDRSIRNAKTAEQFSHALSRFDILARTQLERCGVRPIGG